MRKRSFKSLLATLLLFIPLGVAQSTQQTQPPPPPVATPAQPSATPQQAPGSPQTQPSPPQEPAQPAQPSATPSHRLEIEPVEKEHKITAAEAKELFRSVDEILHFASQDTGLPIRKKVKRTIVSREQVEKYIGDKFKNDADRIRFERSELVQKKFGLLPHQFDLHAFLIKLLTEQVAGYYNEKTRTMNLLDWNEPEMQRPVMAMIVLLDYVLAPSGQSVEKAPQVVDLMQASMDKSRGSPVFDSAPLLLREELAFPYRQGMKFIRDLLVAGGKKLAYAGVLERMPQTSREIMEPKEYLAGRRVPPLLLPDLSFLKKDYEPFDAGAVGELDVNILLRVYADEDVAKRLSPEWRGGAYYAAGRKGAKPPDHNSTAHVGLFYVSKWATEAAAQEFAKTYAEALPTRYKEVRRVHGDAAVPERHQYMSSDGPIFIQQTGNMVVAVESFDEDVAKNLIEEGVKQAEVSSR